MPTLTEFLDWLSPIWVNADINSQETLSKKIAGTKK